MICYYMTLPTCDTSVETDLPQTLIYFALSNSCHAVESDGFALALC